VKLEEVERIKKFIDMLNYAYSNGSSLGKRYSCITSLGFYGGSTVILNNHNIGLATLIEYIDETN
jgi:hypothetical protein